MGDNLAREKAHELKKRPRTIGSSKLDESTQNSNGGEDASSVESNLTFDDSQPVGYRIYSLPKRRPAPNQKMRHSFSCPICQENFSRINNLRVHKERFHRKTLSAGGYTFRCTNLGIHRNSFKRLACFFCGKSMAPTTVLKQYDKRNELVIFPRAFQCQFCYVEFSKTGNKITEGTRLTQATRLLLRREFRREAIRRYYEGIEREDF